MVGTGRHGGMTPRMADAGRGSAAATHCLSGCVVPDAFCARGHPRGLSASFEAWTEPRVTRRIGASPLHSRSPTSSTRRTGAASSGACVAMRPLSPPVAHPAVTARAARGAGGRTPRRTLPAAMPRALSVPVLTAIESYPIRTARASHAGALSRLYPGSRPGPALSGRGRAGAGRGPAEARRDQLGEPPRGVVREAGCVRLDHDPHERLRAGCPHEHAAPPGEAALRVHDGREDLGIVLPSLGKLRADVEQDLRKPVQERLGVLLERAAGVQEHVDELERGHESVARRRVVEKDDVAALLPAHARARVEHALQDVPVSHPRALETHAAAPQRDLDPHIGHHGGHEQVAGQRALPVRRDDAVAVAVVREAQVRPVRPHRGLDDLRVRGPAPRVDVRAVGRGVEPDHRRAQPLPELGRDARRRAVGAVHCDAPAVEPGAGQPREIGEIPFRGIGDVAGPADGRPRGPRQRSGLVHHDLDALLHLVRELEPRRGEELDAVVLHGIVRRRDHRAGVHLELAGEERDPGGRQHAEAEHIGARGAQRGRERGLQQVARDAGVAADGEAPAGPARQHVHRRPAEAVHELGGQVGVRHAADAVRAEKPSHGGQEDGVTITLICAGEIMSTRTPSGTATRGVARCVPRPAADASTCAASAPGVSRCTMSWGPSTWTSTRSGAARAVSPLETPEIRTGTPCRMRASCTRPMWTTAVTCWVAALLPCGSESVTRRVTSPRAPVRSIGAVTALCTVCSVLTDPVSVIVAGVTVTPLTASPAAGAPVSVGTTGTTFVIVPSRTGSVACTIDGSTARPRTSCPVASRRCTGTELTSCWRACEVSSVTTAWRTSSTCVDAPLTSTYSGCVRGVPSVTPDGGTPISVTSTGRRCRMSWSRTTTASDGVRSMTCTSGGAAMYTGTRCSPGLSPLRSTDASSSAGVSSASAERGPWRCTWTRLGACTTTSVGDRPRTCRSRVMSRSIKGFCAVAT